MIAGERARQAGPVDGALVEVKGLTVKAGRRFLLENVDWTVQPGEQWVVFGSNGSGKTTLLSIVSGFGRYTSGEVSLFGEPLSEANVLDVRRRVGWVSSSFFDTYYRNETAMEVILAGATGTLGLDCSIDESNVRQAAEWLARFGIEDKRDMPYSTLSKGQRQVVLLVRALANNPDVLVLDEPCSGLDVDARERVLGLVSGIIRDSNTTVIYVTHYVEELLGESTHALLLKKGRRFAAGKVSECFTDQKMSGLFGHPVHVDKDARGRMHLLVDGGAGTGGWAV